MHSVYLSKTMSLNPYAPPFLHSAAVAASFNPFYTRDEVSYHQQHHLLSTYCIKSNYVYPPTLVVPSPVVTPYAFHQCTHLDLSKPVVAVIPPPVEAYPDVAATAAATQDEFSGGCKERTMFIAMDQKQETIINVATIEEKAKVDSFTRKQSRRTMCLQRRSSCNRSHSAGDDQRRLVWMPKGESLKSPALDEGRGDVTTVMIRNIPNKYSRKMLMEWLDNHCEEENKRLDDKHIKSGVASRSQYDFLYLPIDFKCKGNLGYAFVNFTTSAGAWRLYESMNGQKWEQFKSKKICNICVARIQGRKALVENFQKSVFKCESDEFLPVVFSPPRSGIQITTTDQEQQKPSGSFSLIGSRWRVEC